MPSQKFASEVLHHFVGRKRPLDHEANYKVLAQILRDGELRHWPWTPGGSAMRVELDLTKDPHSEELLNPSVLCFCDIPHGDIGFHASKYGSFGLSFYRKFLRARGTRPVSYFPYGSGSPTEAFSVVSDLWAAYCGFHQHVIEARSGKLPSTRRVGEVPKSEIEALKAIDSVLVTHVLAYVKPFDDRLPEDHLHNYYMEREWRKFGYLSFSPADVGKIYVAPEFKARADREFPHFAEKIEGVQIG